ncbi:MAG TPA: Crp/Fnr family transcriptional regulator [Candidatus Saccharimonadales bacterium]|nr:Crp/Fnr family transcriptional regulator [Candidatus Saccharimonadales bacterium]
MAQNLQFDGNILRDFCSHYPPRLIKKGRPLFYQGEIPRSVMYVRSGVVKLYNISSGGEEKVVGYEGQEALLPSEWLFSRSPVSLYYCDTFTDCEICSIPRDELIDFINSHKDLSLALLDQFISMYIGSTMHLHALEQLRSGDKLLHILQYLVLRFGKEVTKNHYQIPLRLTHQEIANLVGLTRETVSTEIGKLKKTGILSIKDIYYVVNIDKAQRILGESDFNELVL